jgi:hypothetical protein
MVLVVALIFRALIGAEGISTTEAVPYAGDLKFVGSTGPVGQKRGVLRDVGCGERVIMKENDRFFFEVGII